MGREPRIELLGDARIGTLDFENVARTPSQCVRPRGIVRQRGLRELADTTDDLDAWARSLRRT